MRIHATTKDLWTGKRGLSISWDGPRLECAVELGFGNGLRRIWRCRPCRRHVGLHVRGRYVTLRDVRCHPLRFSERQGVGGARRLAGRGNWQVWVRDSPRNLP